MTDSNSDEIVVSIICDCYNHEKYIAQALDSFLMQDCDFKFEVLIHDDASTDNSAAIIKEYELKYPEIIKPIYQKENQYSKKVNIWKDYQFSRAKGKYIAICEGDDYWIDTLKLQKQVDFLENNPSFSLITSQAKVLENNILTDIIGGTYFDSDIYYFKDLIAYNDFITCTSLFRNKKTNIDLLTNVIFGDWFLYTMLLEDNSKAKFFKEVSSVYRVHDKGLMKSLGIGKIYYNLLLQYEFFKKKYNLSKSEIPKKEINKVINFIIDLELKNKNYIDVISLLKRSYLLKRDLSSFKYLYKKL